MGNGLMTSQSVIQNPNIRLNSMDVSENGISVVHDHQNDQLHFMDACTGVTTLIGDHNVGNNCELFGPGGKLYGLDTNNDPWLNLIFQVREALLGLGHLGIAVWPMIVK